jgi:Ca2+-binding EF-hand superfamily protein
MGNQQAVLSDIDVQELKETTPFSDGDLKKLEQRYQTLDKSPEATDGIPYAKMILLPELRGNELCPHVVAANLDGRSGCVYAKQFVQIFGILSPKAQPEEKKEFLFEIFNIYGANVLTHDEVFRMFKTLFDAAVSDDHILALTYRALNHKALKKKGEITKEEFIQLIPDHEIVNRMSVELL